jgi:hypothetical protein
VPDAIKQQGRQHLMELNILEVIIIIIAIIAIIVIILIIVNKIKGCLFKWNIGSSHFSHHG